MLYISVTIKQARRHTTPLCPENYFVQNHRVLLRVIHNMLYSSQPLNHPLLTQHFVAFKTPHIKPLNHLTIKNIQAVLSLCVKLLTHQYFYNKALHVITPTPHSLLPEIAITQLFNTRMTHNTIAGVFSIILGKQSPLRTKAARDLTTAR